MKIVKNRNLGKAADVLSFVAFGMAHQLYYMPVIVMTMDTFFNGEIKVK